MLCDFYSESLAYQENLLTRHYVKHGHEVVVVASVFESLFDFVNDRYDPSSPERIYRADGATIIKLRYRTNYLNRVRTYRPLTDILEQVAPDLVFVHDIHLNLLDAVAYVRRHPRSRLVMDYHADFSNSAKNWLSLKVLHGIIRKRVLDKARPHISRIFPVVPASAAFLTEVYGVPAHEMELLPLGIDLGRVRSVRRSDARGRLRRGLGIAESDVVLFSGGKFDPQKRLDALIEAFGQIVRPDLHLIVIGDASPDTATYGRTLRQLAADVPNVRFTGWLEGDAILEHMHMADMAVFPASQSVLWQQAIGMGLPLIVGDRPTPTGAKQDVDYLNLEGNIDILDGAQPLVPQLARAIDRLAVNATERRRMSAGADATAARLLDWDRLIERTLAPLCKPERPDHGKMPL